MNSPTKEFSIFLSYARQDAPWVAEFTAALQTAGIQRWFDPAHFSAQESFEDTLEAALRQSETLIIFFSPNSLENPNVLFELGAGIGSDKAIIPVLIGNVVPKQIPFSLMKWQWVRAESPSEAARRVADILNKNSRAE